MDLVQNKLEEIVITKHGKPIAKLVPTTNEIENKSPIGFMKGKVTINEDIIKPLDVDWKF